ncbi:hypothetical protein P280DRAFT_465322 [Massarina eburnea CBS 473.64]|uniref:Uncharacterized protein n=1 Tax=Massarina eburnea CBS 473.64 TaxID=1395130 RepID=A0A6A6SDX8_9PLEO|nr:hypothetical protein P280DRAFT_465322 [Massarina eburnea CBS 473.64]
MVIFVESGVQADTKLYIKMTDRSNLLVHFIAGTLFALGAALCQTCFFWAFCESR